MRRVSGHGYTFRVDKHLHSEDFSIEDYYFRAKSSPFGRIRLQGLFFQGEFILIRKNLLPGIIFPRWIHPHSEESSGRDYFLRIKSSSYERICRQGLFSPDKIIPIRKNPPPGMLWEYKSIRHGRKSKLKMHGNRPEAASGICQTSKSNFRRHDDRKQHSKSRDSSRWDH